jgi:predicted DNA-binding antitoxin AbrB/MazE fold protein
VLRPLQPLDLKEHERVVVSVIAAESTGSTLDLEYIDRIKAELRDQPAPGLDEVRRRLAKIPVNGR